MTSLLFRRLVPFLLPLAFLFFSGCMEERTAWSPDGTRATFIANDGLRLFDSNGNLSPVIAPDAYRAAWLPDSKRLVIARSREIKDFATLASLLGPKRTQTLRVKAEAAWAQLDAGISIDNLHLPGKNVTDLEAIILYLRESHRERFRELLAKDEKNKDELKKIEDQVAHWHSLVVAEVVGNTLAVAVTIHEGLQEFYSITPSPGGSAVAFVANLELGNDSDEILLLVAPIDGSSPAETVANKIAGFPDWTSNGLSLVFLASGNVSGSDLRLGAVVERTVLDSAGKIALAKESRDLAGLIFHDSNRLRCLPDGRILFNAAEFHLPISGGNTAARDEFFVVDRTSGTVSRLFSKDAANGLPQSLANFNPSPDGSQILVWNADGEVWMVAVADGKTERFSTGITNVQWAPAWRRAGGFSYAKHGPKRHEIVLHTADGEKTLSESWSDEILGQKKE